MQNGSTVPLGTTSEYCDDFVSTTELVYNLMLGSNCNDSMSKAGLWYACALAVLCIQFAATAETAAIIRCGLRGSVDIKALSTHKVPATAHQHGATRQKYWHTSTSYSKQREGIQAMIKYRCESSWQCMWRCQFVSPRHLPNGRNTHKNPRFYDTYTPLIHYKQMNIMSWNKELKRSGEEANWKAKHFVTYDLYILFTYIRYMYMMIPTLPM